MSEPTQEQAIQAAINRGMAELSMGTVLHYADAKRAFRSVAEHALAAARRPDDESSVIPPIAPALYKCRCKESPAGKCLTCGGAVVPRSFPEAARRLDDESAPPFELSGDERRNVRYLAMKRDDGYEDERDLEDAIMDGVLEVMAMRGSVSEELKAARGVVSNAWSFCRNFAEFYPDYPEGFGESLQNLDASLVHYHNVAGGKDE